jgi:hypothetical protein
MWRNSNGRLGNTIAILSRGPAPPIDPGTLPVGRSRAEKRCGLHHDFPPARGKFDAVPMRPGQRIASPA